MPRLVFEKYKGCESVLRFNLHNGYSIIAIKSRMDDGYSVEFRITENSIDKWDLIQPAENVYFYATPQGINVSILKWVSESFTSGFFDYYISRYEFENKCFEIGLESEEAKDV